MIRLRMKKYSMKLIEMLQKYQHYHQAKLINMTILMAKKFVFKIKSKKKKKLNLLILNLLI